MFRWTAQFVILSFLFTQSTWAATVTTDKLVANTAIIQDLTASAITGNIVGNVTGNVTGDLTGNVIGNLTGEVTTTDINNVEFSSKYVSLNAAITAIGSTPTFLIVTTANFPLTANAVVPSTLVLVPVYAASINQSTYTLTINSPFSPGVYQVFTGSGAVSGLKEARPEWWGANTTPGTTDMTDAIQKAIHAIGSAAGTVLFSPTTYKITSQITNTYSGITLMGMGRSSTKILFLPASNATCFLFDNGSVQMPNFSIRGIGFYSTDTTYTKTMINIVDGAEYTVEDVGTTYPHWMGAGSIGIRINGRQLGWYRDINIEADKPLSIGTIDSPHIATGIGIDHHNFHNCFFRPVGYPAVTIDSGVALSQVSFTGTQAWVGGTYGLYWNDTTSTGISNGLLLENVRWEQGSDITKYMVYISHNTGMQGVRIAGGNGGDRRGFYFRNTDKITFDTFYYTSSTLEALNVDSTVRDIASKNSFWQAGSTATLTGQKLIWASPKNPNTGALAPSFQYTESINTKRSSFGEAITFTPTLVNFTEVLGGGSITKTGRYTLTGNRCFYQIKLICNGGATLAATASAYITGLPVGAADDIANTVNMTTNASLNSSEFQSAGGIVVVPAWTASSSEWVISGSFELEAL